MDILGPVVFAPVVETLLLGLLLKGLLLLTARPVLTAALSALFWGALHGIVAPLWFFGTVWSFFIFACAYLGWHRQSRRKAFIAAAVPHSLINLIAMTILGIT